MRRLASTFGGDADAIDMRTVPAVDQMIDGVAYLVAEEEPTEQLFAAFRAARPAPEGVGTDPAPDSSDDEG